MSDLERLTELARLETYAHRIWTIFGNFYNKQAKSIINAGGPYGLDSDFHSQLEKEKQQVISQVIAIIEEAHE